MTLRSQLKVPRFGLFYFESDKTLSVVPLKKVNKVLEGTNTTEGSVVEIFYGNVLLKAKIIAVDDDDKKLHRRELAFLCDEANRHLFPADTDDETSDLEGQARAEPIVTTNDEKTKKQSKKRKRADNNQPSTSEASQKKAKARKDKSAATVVGRFSPSKGAQPPEPDLPEPDLPEPDLPESVSTPQQHETPTVEQANSPSISCGQTPSTIGPPAAQNSYDKSASRAAPTTTNKHSASPFNDSFNSISPSSPWFPQSRRSRQPRSHVSRHLFADMPVYSYGLPPELWSFLQRLDRRLDYLTGIVEDLQSASHHPVPPPTRQLSQQSVDLNVPTEVPPDQPEQSSNLSEMSPESTSSQLPHERLMALRAQASSSMNFAVRLLRELCPTQELIGKNINGVRGKQAVEPNKVELIRTLVRRFYPSPPGETERIWRECRKAMDSFLRKIPRQN